MEDKKTQIIIRETTQSYGVLSIIFGFVGIFILSPLFSPLAFILGVFACFKNDFISGIIGITFAFIGAWTSPLLLAFFYTLLHSFTSAPIGIQL